MATVADVPVTNTAYVNLNSASGIITGVPLVIQNKGSSPVHVIINPTQPSASSENGFVIDSLKSIIIENETQIVWARAAHPGTAKLSVQPYV
jgi:hypothetical protein